MCEPFMCQFLFPMFDSASRCLATFFLKDNSFFITKDAVQLLLKSITQVYLFEMPKNSHHYNVCALFLKILKLLIVLASSKNRTRTLDLRKNGPPKKRTPWKKNFLGQKLETFRLSFVLG